MSRIPALDPAAVQGKAKDLLDAVQKALGVTPNMFRVAAHSAAALEGLFGLNAAVNHGTLAAKVREQLALAVAESNSCDYCLSVHTFLGKHAGLSDADVVQARQGWAGDPKADAAVRFAQSLVDNRGHPSDAELVALRRGGFSDGEIVDLVAATALNIFTNYLTPSPRQRSTFRWCAQGSRCRLIGHGARRRSGFPLRSPSLAKEVAPWEIRQASRGGPALPAPG